MLEQTIITRLIFDKDQLHVLLDRGIRPDLFETRAPREAFEFILSHVNKYGNVPEFHLVKRRVNKFRLDLESRESLASLADQFLERREYNILKDGLEDAVEAMPNLPKAREALNTLNVNLAVNITPHHKHLELGSSAAEGIADYHFRASQKGLLGVPSGWDAIDVHTLGHQEQEMYFIVGRPNIGKTWILLYSLFTAFEYGEKVLLFVREQSAKVIRRRLHYLITRVPYNDFVRGSLNVRDKKHMMTKLLQYGRLVRENSFFVISESESSIDEIAGTVDKVRPTLIGIDGLALYRDRENSNTRQERLQNEIPAVKDMCQRYNMKAKVTNQLSRASEEFGASLSTIAFSDVVSQDSDVVIAVEVPRANSGLDKKFSRVISIIKNKEGGLVSFPVHFDLDKPKTFLRPMQNHKFSSSEVSDEETPIGID